MKFLSVGAFKVSDDGNLLAYTTDTTGFRQFRLHVKDLRTGGLFSTVPSASPRSSGARTTERSFTRPRTRLPSARTWSGATRWAMRPSRSTRRRIGFSRSDLGRSKDRKMLFLPRTSTDTWEAAVPTQRSTARDVPGRPAAGKGPQVQRGASRWPLLHPHQPGRQELPPGHGTGVGAHAAELERAAAPPG